MFAIRPTYLIMVTAENNNKYYNCFPEGDNFRVEYGRVNSTKTITNYPMSKWEAQISSKIKKGYKDVTDLKTALVEEIKTDGTKYKDIENESVRRIIEKLRSLARDTVKKNYSVSSASVTEEMVYEAQLVINNLISIKSVNKFNDELLKLFEIIPRKMDNVRSYLIKSIDEIDKVISREQDLLDIMRGQIVTKSTATENKAKEIDNSGITILDEMGITMRECTPEEINEIKECMKESSYHFSRAWRVDNISTRKKYEEFIKAYNIKNTKLLFHGSRTENWFSILKTGLKIRPTNAITTGAMFGFGSYFAPKCQKSIGYTSLGGKPYNVYNFDSKYYSMSFDKLPVGCNCLHAHAGNGMLRNDEIVYYKTEQMTIKYLIEIK